MRSREIVAATFTRAFERGEEQREIRMALLARERGKRKTRPRSGREETPRREVRGFRLARVKRKTTTKKDGGGVQPRWHENEA